MTRLLLLVAMLVAASNAQTSLSQSDKQLLLDLHNQERSSVNPTASDMKIMVRLIVTKIYQKPHESLIVKNLSSLYSILCH